MKTAAAIVTNRGGRTCHAAIVARELGIPAVVGQPATRPPACPTARSSRSPAPRATPASVYAGAVPFHVDAHRGRRRWRGRSTQIMINLGNPDLAFKTVVPAQRRRGPGADGVHHQRVHQGAPDGAAASRSRSTTRGAAGRSSALTQRLRRRRRLLRRAPLRGRRHDRRRLLPEAGDRAHVGLQDQRVRQPARRRRLRAARGEPDDRLPRRLALRASGLRRGLRARVPRDASGCATRWG